jgi:hypothetical protein
MKKYKAKPEPDIDEIAMRLRYVNIEEMLRVIFIAIDAVKEATATSSKSSKNVHAEFDQLRETLVFVFGANR